MSISKIETVGRQPLNIIVYENIKKAIIEGEIRPGTRLTETKVGEQMNVSTTPVREAFRRLESERLVKIIPWRGAIVQEISDQELAEVYQCREALEVLAITLAIDLIEDKEIQELEDLIEDLKKAKDFTEHVEVNNTFHNAILKSAKNKTLIAMIEQFNDIIYHNRHISSYSDKRKEQIYFEHGQIVQALKDRDKVAGEEAIRQHVQNGYNYIKAKIPKSNK